MADEYGCDLTGNTLDGYGIEEKIRELLLAKEEVEGQPIVVEQIYRNDADDEDGHRVWEGAWNNGLDRSHPDSYGGVMTFYYFDDGSWGINDD